MCNRVFQAVTYSAKNDKMSIKKQAHFFMLFLAIKRNTTNGICELMSRIDPTRLIQGNPRLRRCAILWVLVVLLVYVGPQINALVQQTMKRVNFSGIFSYKSLRKVAQLLKVSDLISF